jgi:hypothetical protein
MPRRIVGAVWVENPGPWWVPVGLEKTQGPGANPPPYRNINFSGTKLWTNDEEGWQIYYSPRQRRMQKWLRNKSRRQNQMDNDTYNFDDEVDEEMGEYNNYETYDN